MDIEHIEEVSTNETEFPIYSELQFNQTKKVVKIQRQCIDYIEVILLIDGFVDISLVNKEHCFKKGDIICIGKGIIYTINMYENARYILIYFSPDFLKPSRNYKELNEKDIFSMFTQEHKYAILLNSYGSVDFSMNFLKLREELMIKRIGYTLACVGFLHNIISNILRFGKVYDLTQQLKTLNSYKLDEVIDSINKNYSDDLEPDKFAKSMNMSAGYFLQTFKKLYGISFKDYVTQVRLEKAEEMIKFGEKTILDIAMEVGFSSQSSFYRAFNDYFKIKPSDLKRSFGGFISEKSLI